MITCTYILSNRNSDSYDSAVMLNRMGLCYYTRHIEDYICRQIFFDGNRKELCNCYEQFDNFV